MFIACCVLFCVFLVEHADFKFVGRFGRWTLVPLVLCTHYFSRNRFTRAHFRHFSVHKTKTCRNQTFWFLWHKTNKTYCRNVLDIVLHPRQFRLYCRIIHCYDLKMHSSFVVVLLLTRTLLLQYNNKIVYYICFLSKTNNRLKSVIWLCWK